MNDSQIRKSLTH